MRFLLSAVLLFSLVPDSTAQCAGGRCAVGFRGQATSYAFPSAGYQASATYYAAPPVSGDFNLPPGCVKTLPPGYVLNPQSGLYELQTASAPTFGVSESRVGFSGRQTGCIAGCPCPAATTSRSPAQSVVVQQYTDSPATSAEIAALTQSVQQLAAGMQELQRNLTAQRTAINAGFANLDARLKIAEAQIKALAPPTPPTKP